MSRSLKRKEFLDPPCVCLYPIAFCSALCVSLHFMWWKIRSRYDD